MANTMSDKLQFVAVQRQRQTKVRRTSLPFLTLPRRHLYYSLFFKSDIYQTHLAGAGDFQLCPRSKGTKIWVREVRLLWWAPATWVRQQRIGWPQKNWATWCWSISLKA